LIDGVNVDVAVAGVVLVLVVVVVVVMVVVVVVFAIVSLSLWLLLFSPSLHLHKPDLLHPLHTPTILPSPLPSTSHPPISSTLIFESVQLSLWRLPFIYPPHPLPRPSSQRHNCNP
jgi:hypothetical protein